jgi:hypothetical protein
MLKRMPLSEAVEHLTSAKTPTAHVPREFSNPTAFFQAIHSALKKTSLSTCWSDMAGVLLWINLVAGAASHKLNAPVLKKHFSALSVRVAMFLCFEHPEAIHATLLKMTEFVGSLSEGDAT